ncbi:MAG: beta-lactamase family protein [Clostridia bacterium]|nr:beta-lactamase family protein [Clostridia bacterium]
MQNLYSNMRYLCDESRMLTGICVSYGTAGQSECAIYGRAQEVRLHDGGFIPHERPLTSESIYDLASLTKLLVCVTTMRLVELGQLSLNECVGNIDPRFVHLADVPVHDVLCYRVCLQTPGRIDDAPTREEGLRRLFDVRTAPLPPVRIYSDINAMVIKYMIEAKSGMPLYDAIKRHVLEPSGMTETFSAVPLELLERCVCYNYEHRIVRDRYILRDNVGAGMPHDPKALLLCNGGLDLCGHAGLFSTMQDMTRFAQALLRGDIIRRDTLLTIATNRTGQYNADGTYRQPLGFLCFLRHPLQRLSEVPAHMGAHGFGISGFTGNHLVIDPDLGIFELFLGNRCHARVSHITPPEGKSIEEFGLDEYGAGNIAWPDGRLVPTSAKYVYRKDACLHEPIVQRMHQLDWL